mmetsp:Transcript_79834/g.191590  ORF Transcript_79834/g.191590 Transcript_79834/m.191590 type:complete len:347 (-) Transcript_79834:274-1314(-)
MQVRFCDPVAVLLATSLNLEVDLARKLPRGLMANVGHHLQGSALLGTLAHAQRHLDAHFAAALAALLLLFPHANHLPTEGRHAILWNLNLLWRTPSAVLAFRLARIFLAPSANHQPRESEDLLLHSIVEIRRRYVYHYLQLLALKLLLNLGLNASLVELLLLLLDLCLEHLVLRVILRHLIQLRIQLSFLPFHLLPGDLHILYELHTTQVVLPAFLGITQDLIGFPEFVENMRITTFVRMVLHGQAPEFALNRALICILRNIKHLVKVRTNHAVLFICHGNPLEAQFAFLSGALARFFHDQGNLLKLALLLVLELLAIHLVQSFDGEFHHLQLWRVDQDTAIVGRP